MKEYDDILFNELNSAATWYYCHGLQSEYREIWALVTVSKRMQKESLTGEYDILKLELKKEQVYDCGEYTGPIQIQLVPGKGRGIIATAPINAGQVIMGCKAFAIVFPPIPTNSEEEEIGDTFDVNNLESGDCKETVDKPNEEQTLKKQLSANFSRLMFNIINMLQANPDLFEEVGALNCGTNFFPIPTIDFGQGSASTITGAGGDTSIQQEKIELERIVCLNGTLSGSNPDTRGLPDPDEIDGLVSKNTYGLWILPSYLNHSCVDINAELRIFGDMMIVRALKNISPGEEILVCYTNYGRIETEPSILEQKELREIHNFICHCRLCQLATAEPDWLRQQRKQVIDLTLKDDADLEDIEIQLEALLPNYPDLNFSIFWLCWKIASIHRTPKMGMYIKAACYFEKAYNLTKFSGLFRHRIPLAIETCCCYIQVRDKTEAMKWTEKLKMDLKITYGMVTDLERFLPIIAKNNKMEIDSDIMTNLTYLCLNASDKDLYKADDDIDREIPLLIEGVRQSMIISSKIKTE